MKKIRILFSFLFILVICFIGTSKVYASIMPPLEGGGSGSGTPEFFCLNGGNEMKIDDNSYWYTAPFTPEKDYNYLEVCVTSIQKNSVVFIVQEYKNNLWSLVKNETLDATNEKSYGGLWADDSKNGKIYLMFCGNDSTNYVTPADATTGNVSSQSISSDSTPIKANHTYRIIIYNPWQWNGDTSLVKANVRLKTMSL